VAKSYLRKNPSEAAKKEGIFKPRMQTSKLIQLDVHQKKTKSLTDSMSHPGWLINDGILDFRHCEIIPRYTWAGFNPRIITQPTSVFFVAQLDVHHLKKLQLFPTKITRICRPEEVAMISSSRAMKPERSLCTKA